MPEFDAANPPVAPVSSATLVGGIFTACAPPTLLELPPTPPPVRPTVENLAPADGSTLSGPMDPVTFDIVDTDSTVVYTTIWLRYTGFDNTRVIWDGDGFTPEFSASSRVPISNGFTYTIVPTDGWVGDFDMRARVVDTTGLIDLEM